MSTVPRHLYIGAIALLCRMHAAMDPKERQRFDAANGDPMKRVSVHFNGIHDLSVSMVPNGKTWMIDHAEEAPKEEA